MEDCTTVLRPTARRYYLVRKLGLLLLAAVPVTLWAYREPVLMSAARFLVLSDPPEKADLVYVLAGDFYGSRVLLGAELGAKGYASKVIMSGGMYGDAYQGDLAARFAVQHGYSQALFETVLTRAQSTVEEAIEMRPIFERHHAKRVILVTSDFHSRRADLVFRLFDPGIHFSTVGAPAKLIGTDFWWKSEATRHLLFGEYSKILGTLLVRMLPANAIK